MIARGPFQPKQVFDSVIRIGEGLLMGITCQCSVLHGNICAQYSLAVRGQTDSALTA